VTKTWTITEVDLYMLIQLRIHMTITLKEHMIYMGFLSGVRVVRSLVLCVVFCISFFPFVGFLWHFIVCPSRIYGTGCSFLVFSNLS